MLRISLPVILALAAPWSVFAQEANVALPEGPSETAKAAARNLVKLLAQEHYVMRTFDEELAERWLKLFLKELDEYKLYFTREDHDAFRKRQKEYFEAFPKGEIRFFYDIYRLFRERVEERTKLI